MKPYLRQSKEDKRHCHSGCLSMQESRLYLEFPHGVTEAEFRSIFNRKMELLYIHYKSRSRTCVTERYSPRHAQTILRSFHIQNRSALRDYLSQQPPLYLTITWRKPQG